jgi:acetyltransferase-like isoleucine patch superfamily enzyme
LTLEERKETDRFFREVLHRPHPKLGAGQLSINDEWDCKHYEVDTTVHISRMARIDLTGNVILNAWVMVGHGAHLLTHDHMFPDCSLPMLMQYKKNPEQAIKIVDKIIHRDVWLNKCLILPQCNEIAEGVIIGAEAVVTKPILKPYTVWAGNPARMIKDREKLKKRTVIYYCGCTAEFTEGQTPSAMCEKHGKQIKDEVNEN